MTRKEKAELRKGLVYLFIVQNMLVRGYPPTHRDIVNDGYCKSTSHAHKILLDLEKDEVIQYVGKGHYIVAGGKWTPPPIVYMITAKYLTEAKNAYEDATANH
jgi:SOS-response transcriptional repressor LexA